MIDIEPSLKLALALYSNPGVYALLVGSGLSRSAGILTGWEILLDLIRKVAKLYNEDPEPNPEKWFIKKFGKPPNYSELLKLLAETPSERRALLNSYFEPTKEEKENGLKIPTKAHKAIAKLVKKGYIKMIITTNFDRLLEKALEEEGVTPDVVSSPEHLKGATPYIHSKCFVMKVHGDYKDARIRNTEEELAKYPRKLDKFLDEIFDRFGLIIVGWSGEWDTALRNAIMRAPNRRYTTFWLAHKGRKGEKAKEIITNRRAEVIPIESAEKFFPELLEKVESLEELKTPHPLSVKVALEIVKKYLSEPEKYRIKLYDLILEEARKIYRRLRDEFPELKPYEINDEVIISRLKQYEIIMERLIKILATLAYYDQGRS